MTELSDDSLTSPRHRGRETNGSDAAFKPAPDKQVALVQPRRDGRDEAQACGVSSSTASRCVRIPSVFVSLSDWSRARHG